METAVLVWRPLLLGLDKDTVQKGPIMVDPKYTLPNFIIPIAFCIGICLASIVSLVMMTWILCR